MSFPPNPSRISTCFAAISTISKTTPAGTGLNANCSDWGWTPATWQGWAVTGIYALLILLFATTINPTSPPQEVAFTFFLPVLLLTITFLRIAYKTGETPRWQWGFPQKYKR